MLWAMFYWETSGPVNHLDVILKPPTSLNTVTDPSIMETVRGDGSGDGAVLDDRGE